MEKRINNEFKKKMDILFNAGEEVRTLAVRQGDIVTICEAIAITKAYEMMYVILERLEAEKDDKKAKEAYRKLAKSESCDIRKDLIEKSPIEFVCEMAVVEEDWDLIDRIIERVEKSQESENASIDYNMLIRSKSNIIRSFVAKTAPIEFVYEMALVEDDESVVDEILKRFRELNLSEEVYEKLSRAKNYKIRLFVVFNASAEIVCEIALTEENSDVVTAIIKRIRNEDEFSEHYYKLASAQSYLIKDFVAKIAPVSVVCEMAGKEHGSCVMNTILKRLNEFSYEELEEFYGKLSKAAKPSIRGFTAKKAPVEIVPEMAYVEDDELVLDVISSRLKTLTIEQKKTLDYNKLLNSTDFDIRQVALSIIPIEELKQIVETKEENSVLKVLNEIL